MQNYQINFKSNRNYSNKNNNYTYQGNSYNYPYQNYPYNNKDNYYQYDSYNNIPQQTTANTKQKKKHPFRKIIAGICALVLGSNVVQAALTNKNIQNAIDEFFAGTPSYSDSYDILSELEKNTFSTTKNSEINNTKDYTIEDTEQGKIADCWLLCVINSINETEKGKEFFANMFEYKEGETIVHLHVGDYTISDKELKNNKRGKSTGDTDVLLIELAVEKALDDYNEGEITLPEEVITDALGGDGSSSTLNMGTQDAAVYILTGEIAEYLKIKKHEEKVDKYFEKFATSEKENMSITASIEYDGTTIKNSNGKDVKLNGNHAYTIKSIDKNGIVTVTNPYDSAEEIEMDYETFKEIFSSITVADISNIA